MIVKVTLRYLARTSVCIKTEEEVPEGITAGELSAQIIKAHEAQENIHFTGANVAMLLNGKLVFDDYPLNDGDELQIIPVAAGG